MVSYVGYVVAALIAVIYIRRRIMFGIVKENLPNYLKEGAVILDVRTREEFRSGNAKGSINIPLQELQGNLEKLETGKTILVCCHSGNRSGTAAGFLKSKGFKNVVNAGPWVNLA
jgi:phage shock protein E